MRHLLSPALFFCFMSTLCATPHVDLGLTLGSLQPKDTKMSGSFGRDFYLQGHLGAYDKNSGFEFRGNWGHYSSPSMNKDDVGTGTRLDITPLTASLLYHMGEPDTFMQPYVGGGLGAYFYGLKDTTYGELESGTQFGAHLIGGLKFQITPQFYLQMEYTRSFAGPVLFDNSQNFDTDTFTFGIGILSNPMASPTRTKANQEKYEDLLLAQIKDLTEEIQKIKEDKKKIEARINTFYETAASQTYVPLLTSMDEPLKGRKLKITHPVTQTVLAEGLIDDVTQNATSTHITLENDKGWQLSVSLENTMQTLRIGNKTYPDIPNTLFSKALQVEALRDDATFAQELRRVQYLETKLISINLQLKEAEAQLATYHHQWKETQPKVETVIVDDRRYTPPPVIIQSDYHYHHRQGYRYYNPQDYVVPVYVPSNPPSPQEKAQFLEAKRERIRSIKSR